MDSDLKLGCLPLKLSLPNSNSLFSDKKTSLITKAVWAKGRKLSNGNRTEWSPIQSVIIRVITKSEDRAAGVRFVYHEYDYRLNWTTRSPIIN